MITDTQRVCRRQHSDVEPVDGLDLDHSHIGRSVRTDHLPVDEPPVREPNVDDIPGGVDHMRGRQDEAGSVVDDAGAQGGPSLDLDDRRANRRRDLRDRLHRRGRCGWR